jgi:hypothetical protein
MGRDLLRRRLCRIFAATLAGTGSGMVSPAAANRQRAGFTEPPDSTPAKLGLIQS